MDFVCGMFRTGHRVGKWIRVSQGLGGGGSVELVLNGKGCFME